MNIERLYEIFTAHPRVQTDTRRLQQGDLFFSLKGPQFNGNEFAKQALDSDAAFAIVDEVAFATDDRCILVDNVLQTLQALARLHRRRFDIPFLAITGSNGKTTTKELITTVLRKKYRTCATAGNLNNHIGVPLTLLSIREDAEMAVIEMGANHQGEIASYCAIAEPTHGLITNCGKAHIEGFGGEEGVRKGKGELYDYLRANGGAVFRYNDAEYLSQMAAGIAQQITYGTPGAAFSGRPSMREAFLDIALEDEANTVLHTKLVGDYNFPNVMSAVAVGRHFGVSMPDIKEALEDYAPDNSRSQWIQIGSNNVILDAYNANPTSMKAAIEAFAAAPLSNKHLWIGGMKEMGEDEAAEHEALVALIDQHRWNEVILVGAELKQARGTHKWFADSAEAAAFVKNAPPSRAAILIKGSRGSRMERMLDAIS